MNLGDLEKKGAFVDNSLKPFSEVWRHVDEKNGKKENNFIVEDEVSFFVRQASWLEFTQSVEAKQTEENKAQPLNNEALAVAACVRLGENGEEKLTYNMVTRLEPTLYYIFRNAVFEVYSPKS